MRCVDDQCQELIVTISYHGLMKKLGSSAKLQDFLLKHREELNVAAKILSEPLTELNEMHKVKLRPKGVEKKIANKRRRTAAPPHE